MSRDEKIVQMALEGIRPAIIAMRLHCRSEECYRAIRNARARGVKIPFFAKRAPINTEKAALPKIVINVRLHDLLNKEAIRRERTMTEVAEAILEAGLLDKARFHDT